MAKHKGECIFCKIIRREAKEEIVKSSDNFVAIRDASPIADGHMLIIPKQHYITLLDIPDELGKELLQFTKLVASNILDKKLGNGFNTIMNNMSSAGQFVMHAHIHVIPRKDSDGIKFLVR